MTKMQEIPLTPFASTMDISILGKSYVFRTQYRDAPNAGWILDIADDITGRDLVCGIPLVGGLDLLWQHRHLEFGFHLVMVLRDGRGAPTYQSLGVDDKLYMVILDG